MGVVYKATDLRLKRTVAIKLLPTELAQDPDRRARLLREARAASSLNHPNIVTVHEIDSAEGIDFVAMEFVEGRAPRPPDRCGRSRSARGFRTCRPDRSRAGRRARSRCPPP
jgi:serine/threonine protein kinase